MELVYFLLGLLAPYRHCAWNWSRYRKLDGQDLGKVQEGCCRRDGSPSCCWIAKACSRNVRIITGYMRRFITTRCRRTVLLLWMKIRSFVVDNIDILFLYFVQMYSPDQKKLEIMIGDFMKAKLPYFDVCISNTPYQVNFHGEKTIRITTISNQPRK